MLRKKDLLELPAPYMPSAEVVPEASIPEAGYLCEAKIASVSGANILEIDIWALNVDTPIGLIARIFVSKSDKRHVSLLMGKREHNYQAKSYTYTPFSAPRWSEASVEKVTDGSTFYTDLNRRIAVASESNGVVKRYFGGKDKTDMDALGRFQKKLREKAIAQRNKSRKDAVNRVMVQIAELPADWDDFVENNVLLDSRYIIYERTRAKKIIGFCTKCGADVSLATAHHNTKGVCPACGSPVRLKAKGITHHISDWGTMAHYIQPVKGGAFFVREYEFYRRFEAGFRKWEQGGWETRRFFFTPDSITMYDRYEGQWRARKTIDYISGYLYPNNVKSSLAPTEYRYCAADVLASRRVAFCLIGWLERYERQPLIEYFPKMSLLSLSQDLSTGCDQAGIINPKAKTPSEAFPFSRETIKMFCALDMNAYEIKLYAAYAKKGYTITSERMLEFRKMQAPAYELLGMPNGIDPFSALRYIKKQKTGDRTFQNLISIWRDYLRMAAAAEYDLADEYYIFPPKLVAMHDELDALTRMKAISPKYIVKFEKLAEKYIPFNFESKDYIIRVPKAMEDLIYNGMKQKICVANPDNGYIQAYCSEKKFLFFLRKRDCPDTPYVTFEMSSDGHIGQVSAYDNRSPVPAVNRAIEVWRKKIAEPILEKKSLRTKIPVEV